MRVVEPQLESQAAGAAAEGNHHSAAHVHDPQGAGRLGLMVPFVVLPVRRELFSTGSDFEELVNGLVFTRLGIVPGTEGRHRQHQYEIGNRAHAEERASFVTGANRANPLETTRR